MSRLALAPLLAGCFYHPPDEIGEIEVPVAAANGPLDLDASLAEIGDGFDGVAFVAGSPDEPGAVIIEVGGRIEVLGLRYCAVVPDRTHFCERKILLDVTLEQCVRHGILLHELGHVFGLEHERDSENVMSDYPPNLGTEITDEQHRRVYSAAMAYSTCLEEL